VRTRLAASFRYFISQRPIPKESGGRIAVLEILKSTMRTREYIEKGDGEGRSLLDAMKDGELDGMQHFDGELEFMSGRRDPSRCVSSLPLMWGMTTSVRRRWIVPAWFSHRSKRLSACGSAGSATRAAASLEVADITAQVSSKLGVRVMPECPSRAATYAPPPR
jgi:hypothetical protein